MLMETSLESQRASRSDRRGSSHGDLVDEVAMANIEVKGGNVMVDIARKAQVPLDIKADDFG